MFQLWCELRSLITTPHRHLSQPPWWHSQWRPLSPTITPKSRPEPPRSPTCRSVNSDGRLCQFRWTRCNQCLRPRGFLQLLQQLPTERVEQKEIPAEHMILKSTFDSLVQRCQLAARDPVSPPEWSAVFHRQTHNPFFWTKENFFLMLPFPANKKETWWFCKAFGIPLRQTERAVGKK